MTLLRRFVEFTRSKQWAMTVSIVTAVLLQVPSLVDLIEGEVNGVESWNVAGVAMLLAGLVIRGKVWAQATVDRIEQDALHRAPEGFELRPILPMRPVTFVEHELGTTVASTPPMFGLHNAAADVPPASADVPPIYGCGQ